MECFKADIVQLNFADTVSFLYFWSSLTRRASVTALRVIMCMMHIINNRKQDNNRFLL